MGCFCCCFIGPLLVCMCECPSRWINNSVLWPLVSYHFPIPPFDESDGWASHKRWMPLNWIWWLLLNTLNICHVINYQSLNFNGNDKSLHSVWIATKSLVHAYLVVWVIFEQKNRWNSQRSFQHHIDTHTHTHGHGHTDTSTLHR